MDYEKIININKDNWCKNHKSKYSIKGDTFIIEGKNKNHQHKILPKDYQKIIDYSQKENNIIEILSITASTITTKFYPDLFPLCLLKQNNFYRKQVVDARLKLLLEFLHDVDRVRVLYNRICDSISEFACNTGYQITDVSGNNILIDTNFDFFRIVDTQCIAPYESNNPLQKAEEFKGGAVIFDPFTTIICNTKGNKNIRYLKEDVLKKIRENTFKHITARSFRKSEWEDPNSKYWQDRLKAKT
jgi:hypothetical protein